MRLVLRTRGTPPGLNSLGQPGLDLCPFCLAEFAFLIHSSQFGFKGIQVITAIGEASLLGPSGQVADAFVSGLSAPFLGTGLGSNLQSTYKESSGHDFASLKEFVVCI